MTQQPIPSSNDLARFAAAIVRHIGLEMSEAPAPMLATVLARQAADGGVPAYLRALEQPVLALDVRRRLAQELTVGESYFFRNVEQFAALLEVALPLARRRREGGAVRVLSAGCAAGEEAYSIAIALRELGVPSVIRACDINPDVIARAVAGRYTTWALRELPERHRHWFRSDGVNEVVLDSSIRSAVQFEEVNLVEPAASLWIPGAFDIVFCRNILMYLRREHAVALVGRITQSLAPDGHLFVGHAETLRGMTDDLLLQHTHNTFYYQRRRDEDGSRSTRPRSIAMSTPHEAVTSYPSPPLAPPLLPLTAPRVPALPPHVPDEGLIHRALDLLASERFVEAETLLATAPPSPEARLIGAMLLVHRGLYRDAMARSESLTPEEQASAEHCYLRGLCREAASDWALAADDYRDAAARDARFAMPWLQLGLLARRRSDRRDAERCLERAIALLPGESEAHLRLFGGGFGRAALLGLCRAELNRLATEGTRR